MRASTFCITKNMPLTLTANSRSYIASSLSSSGARSNTAALLNSTSDRAKTALGRVQHRLDLPGAR